MPCSCPLSVHLYIIWLILILINGTIWPDIEAVPHCVIYYLRILLCLILSFLPLYLLEHSDLTIKITLIWIQWTRTLVLLSEEEVKHLVIWRRFIYWSYNPALQIWFYHWSRVRLLNLRLSHSALGWGSSKILSKTSWTRYWCLECSCACWRYLKPSCLLMLNCPYVRHTPSLKSQMRCGLWIYTWVHL